jgi:hypothetical protein
MMTKMSWLPADGGAPMAVGAPHLAVVDLCLEEVQRMLLEGERHHAFAAFGAHVVELQDHDVRFSASDTGRASKVVQDES